MTDAPPMDPLVRSPGILFNGTAFAIFVVAL